MRAVRVAEASGTDARVEDGEIRRMVDAVAEAVDRRADDQALVARARGDQAHAERLQADTAEQHRARAEAIHHETGQRLEKRRDRIEERHREAKRRIRHAEVFLDQRKQRRHHHLEEMAAAVRERDQRDDPIVVSLFQETIFLTKDEIAGTTVSACPPNGLWPPFSSFSSSQGPFTRRPISSSCAMVPYSSSKPWIASTGHEMRGRNSSRMSQRSQSGLSQTSAQPENVFLTSR